MHAKRILSAFIVLAAATVTNATVANATVNVTTLNQQLKAKNAGWVAKETYLSHLSPAEVQRRFGLSEKLSPEVEFIDESPKSLAVTALPAALDWRNKDGVNWVSPLLNQANCGSCVAFAAVGTMETQMRIASANPNYNISLSTQNLFACGGGGCETGWMPEDAANFLQRKGVVDEACQPYMSGATGSDMKCSAACADANKRTYKIAGFTKPTSYFKNLEAVKSALQDGPLVTTVMVYEDFMSYSSGVYKHATGKFLGGHAISIVGYDDAAQAFIIRNSWGPEWGENGFGRVSYKDLSGVGSQTWAFQVPSQNGSVFIASPRDYTYVANSLPLQTQSTLANTDSLAVTIFDGNMKPVLNVSCSANCNPTVDVSALPDGRYQIQTIAMDTLGRSVGTSPIQAFVVANRQPEITVSFTGKGIDLKAPLKGRVEFDIDTRSTSVPLSGLEFHYRDSKGVETVKAINVVIPKMSMGWRTNLVPNETYEIWMVGRVKTNQFEAIAETPRLTVRTQN